jgi:nucleolar protein 58
MGIFVLTETSAGLALFKAKDKQIFKNGEFSTDIDAEKINGL